MARKTINQLTELTEISGNDELAVYDTSTSSTKKSKVFQIAMPVGVILPYGGATAPDGWLLCNGEEKDISAYQNLYNVIGNSFGTASTGKFRVPDMREAVPKGAGLTGKSVGSHVSSNGLSVGGFIDDRLQDHYHQMNIKLGSGSETVIARETGNPSIINDEVRNISPSLSARKGATTEVKSVGVNYIIKY